MHIFVQTDLFHMLTIGEWCSVNTVYCATDCLTTVWLKEGHLVQTLLDKLHVRMFQYFLLGLLHILCGRTIAVLVYSHFLLLTRIL